MATIELDIATKVVSPDQNIWSVFPGLGRRFFGQFRDEGLIFLDTPAIRLTAKALEDDEILRQHVAMSVAWADYYRGRTENSPSRRPADYTPPKNVSFNAAVGNVRNVFIRMRPGDLVVVGGYTYYEPILVGEIREPFDPDVIVHVERYGGEAIPARRVRWFPVKLERRFLSQRLSFLLSNRKAVITVPKAEFADEIYKIAYGDYVFVGCGTDN